MTASKKVYTKEKCDQVTTYVSSDQVKEPSITEKYYDLVTDFFEYGWGKSFHFAPQKPGEKMVDAMVRYELRVSDALKLNPSMKVLDVGCGIGGPMLTIARHSGAQVVGLNINAYQISKAKTYMQKNNLEHLCSFIQGNFMDVDLPDASFDAIYAIEATPHAPDKTACFKELYRLLKPGGLFSGYEYVLKDKFNPENPDHVETIERLEHGGGLQKLPYQKDVEKSFQEAGFTIQKIEDVCHKDLSWSLPLEKGIRSSRIARSLTKVIVRFLEALRIAPEGSTAVSGFLNGAADAFVKAAKEELCTPNLFFLVKKEN